MNSFFKSKHCQSQLHCKACRNIESQNFRQSLIAEYSDIKEINFECPYGKFWGLQSSNEKVDKKNIINGDYILNNMDKFSYVNDVYNRAKKIQEEINEEKCQKCMRSKKLREFSDYVFGELLASKNFSSLDDLNHDSTYIIYKNKGYFIKDFMEIK